MSIFNVSPHSNSFFFCVCDYAWRVLNLSSVLCWAAAPRPLVADCRHHCLLMSCRMPDPLAENNPGVVLFLESALVPFGTVWLLPVHFRVEFVQLACQSAASGTLVAPPSGGPYCTCSFLSSSLLKKKKKENKKRPLLLLIAWFSPLSSIEAAALTFFTSARCCCFVPWTPTVLEDQQQLPHLVRLSLQLKMWKFLSQFNQLLCCWLSQKAGSGSVSVHFKDKVAELCHPRAPDQTITSLQLMNLSYPIFQNHFSFFLHR